MTTMFTMTAEQQAERAAIRNQVQGMAADFGVDADCLVSAMIYLKGIMLEATTEQQAIIFANPNEFVQTGMKKFAEASTKFYTELLNDKARLDAFKLELYNELRARKA